MNKQPVIGISGCLTGSTVRFDGGHKRMSFVMDGLAQWVAFKPICPEMAIGLPSPRPALRLVQTTEGDFRLHFSQAPHDDMTEKMAEFTDSYLSHLDELSGFIVCAKSPSCGMERVRLYDERAIAGVKRAWASLPGRCWRNTRGYRSKKMAACTTRCCGKTLSSVSSPCTS